ncbi:hypothetical protein BQ1740_0858 [Bacillus subtilis]|nr:hypothetical protein BQ1740_0858 [Bacillus subtilis]
MSSIPFFASDAVLTTSEKDCCVLKRKTQFIDNDYHYQL